MHFWLCFRARPLRSAHNARLFFCHTAFYGHGGGGQTQARALCFWLARAPTLRCTARHKKRGSERTVASSRKSTPAATNISCKFAAVTLRVYLWITPPPPPQGGAHGSGCIVFFYFLPFAVILCYFLVDFLYSLFGGFPLNFWAVIASASKYKAVTASLL